MQYNFCRWNGSNWTRKNAEPKYQFGWVVHRLEAMPLIKMGERIHIMNWMCPHLTYSYRPNLFVIYLWMCVTFSKISINFPIFSYSTANKDFKCRGASFEEVILVCPFLKSYLSWLMVLENKSTALFKSSTQICEKEGTRIISDE